MSHPSNNLPVIIEPLEPNRVTQAILDFVSHVPGSRVASSGDPDAEAKRLAKRAAQRAGLAAGSLALPPGPLGWLTLLPEMTLIWKIQGQMVSDIAAAYGRHATLGREQMLWCLFRHTAAQAFRDLVVRMGDRLIFRSMSHAIAQRVAKKIGLKLTQRSIGEGLSRWLPVVGALGVGAYAYYDTGQVAKTAIALFSGNMEIVDDTAAIDAGALSNYDLTTAVPEKSLRQKVAAAAGSAVKKTVKKVAGSVVDKARSISARPINGPTDLSGAAATENIAAPPPEPTAND